MDEVSCRAFSAMEAAASACGIDPETLIEGLPVTLAELRDPNGRVDWEVFAAMCAAYERLLGAAACARVGELATSTSLAEPVRRVAGLLLNPRQLYVMGARWFAPSLFRNVSYTIRDAPGETLALEVAIAPGYSASAAWMRMVAGALRVMPRVLGLADAEVVAEIDGRCSRFRITPPAPPAPRLAALRRLLSTHGALDELARQQDEIRRVHAERVRSDAAARTTERLFRTLIEGVHELIGILEADGTIRFVNAASQRTLGHPTASMIGRALLDFVHPDDAASVAPALAASAGGEQTLELRFPPAAGEHFTVEAPAPNHLADPVVRGIVVNGRDVTERRRAERALREQERAHSRLLANLSGMAYRCRNDAAWTMELVIGRCFELTGYEASELRDDRVVAFGDLVHPDDAGPLWERCQASLGARRPCQSEYRIRTRSGEVRWVLDLAHGVYGADGELVAIEGFITDVTARRRLEEQLLHSQKLEGIGRLAGGIAHDFNNLLGAMLGYAHMARSGLPRGDQRRADIEDIEEAARRAGDLTRQLLAFARRQVIEPKILELNQLALGVDKLLRRVLGEDIELVTLPAPDLWSVKADPGQIEQVLVNLAVNARDAMPQGGKLTIETANVELDAEYAAAHEGVTAGPHVLVAVSDTGTGLSEEARAHLFEPFFTTKDTGKGTGLGLATCYGIVKQAGGSIYVYSEVGEGTTFKIYLPRAVGPVETPVPSALRPAPIGTETILLVEDHAMVREIAARTLASQGYRVLKAQSGGEALAIAGAHDGPLDLLLTDVVMPEMSGHQLADRLAAARPKMSVLYVSGYTENTVIDHGVPGRGVAFLAKPFTPDALAAKVREVLDGARDAAR